MTDINFNQSIKNDGQGLEKKKGESNGISDEKIQTLQEIWGNLLLLNLLWETSSSR